MGKREKKGRERGRKEGRERERRGGRDRVELGDIPVLLLCYDINALLSHGIKKEAYQDIISQ